jgi:tRNA 2-thiouridine synthesizing protein A
LKVEFSVPEVPQALIALIDANVLTQVVAAEMDACGLHCPLPLLKARQALHELGVGELLRVLATDAGSLKDFVSFAQITGQVIQGFYMQDGVYYYLICKR